LHNEVNKGFNKYKKSTDNEINANETSTELFAAASANDYAFLDKIIKNYNHSMLIKKASLKNKDNT
jgi:hypothetical protein